MCSAPVHRRIVLIYPAVANGWKLKQHVLMSLVSSGTTVLTRPSAHMLRQQFLHSVNIQLSRRMVRPIPG